GGDSPGVANGTFVRFFDSERCLPYPVTLRIMNRVSAMEMPVFRQRTPKASERLARQLATLIVEGELEEGARLPHESEMLAQLQVGRATLREALRLLEVWGLVVIRTGPGGGPTVRRPS